VTIDEGFGTNNDWVVEDMRRRWEDSPASVPEVWRVFFETGSVPEPEPRPQPQPEPAAAEQPPAAAPQPASQPQPSAQPQKPAREPHLHDDDEVVPLRGASATVAERMEESREIPTATSIRVIPAKLLEVNRTILNNQLRRLDHGGKVSFTHIIGWAVTRALTDRPAMNTSYALIDGKPHAVKHGSVGLGLAMDMPRSDGSRMLLVPAIKGADTMSFSEYREEYERMVDKVRDGDITPEDFAGTTATLTNPGTVGTVQSVPRLMPDQGVIVGVGAIAYPPEYQAADPKTLARLGVGRTITITSTYDHRVIQGAESGLFLARIHELLLGEHGFYDEIFQSMEIPYVPARWAVDDNPQPGSREWAEKQARVFQMINIYRVRGHLIADLDPLRLAKPSIHKELDPLTYGVTIWDLDREFATGGLGGEPILPAGKILGLIRDAYCRTIGVEYMHIQVPEEKAWIQRHVEQPQEPLSPQDKRRILHKLNEAEAFEQFIHTKYLGHKRFSLEGSESLIPLMDGLLSAAADRGIEDVTIGMAHRGRLNVLANIIGKSYAQVFHEFEGGATSPGTTHGSGDVKYHVGSKGTHKSPSGEQVAVEVASNPSHLEAVDPVLEGMVRAKQERLDAGAQDRVLPVLLHGDAAFAGQGVVAETLQLSQLYGYYTGGTVHIVVNNQVGFTTDAADARSTFYATDVAKAVQAPIFHVNGDDPEAVLRVVRLAFEFRMQFNKDVVIDMVAYRRLGHNEGDDPSLTQPVMYRAIEQHPSVREIYRDRLIVRDELSQEEAEESAAAFKALLDQAFEETKGLAGKRVAPEPEEEIDTDAAVPTGVSVDRIAAIEDTLATVPDGFTIHPKIKKVLDDRHELFTEGLVDWALAEALAFGSLAEDGHGVRLAGEDSRRGTFSHRHAVLVDHETEREWCPLERLQNGAEIAIVDSMLSEFAAMGFEYGYSVIATDSLVLWEAQFGDFVNGAQVVIDQFVSAGFDKWRQRSGLVLLLPHGFEGQGPEHSSARIERFLNLSAEDNWRVINPTTPGQYFHALRRQVLHPDRKPLIVFTPKSLLRTRTSFTEVSDLANGSFEPVISDIDHRDARRVVMCSGKVYYDLEEYREKQGIEDVAIARIEELYPFPVQEVERLLDRHPGAEVMWVQEEPANMGAWRHAYFWLTRRLGAKPSLSSRENSASPATGSYAVHTEEQQELVEVAFR
jgi:2-oxoglutarate dehydrogenase E1 component